ncbi:XPG domain containing-domain-containing protein [Aspergillus californicus]
MGIPRLRQHLVPFSQTVLLQKKKKTDQEDLACIQSVVIDGPSLVYNVYARLLSWFSASGSNMIDSLPTCDEVSRGVMVYLLHLMVCGVEVKKIFFDGALPAQKHEIRITRLESQRKKLELLCSVTNDGFDRSKSGSNTRRNVGPENVLRSRPMPVSYADAPANPFMVPVVFEDLKCRWNRQSITRVVGEGLASHLPDFGLQFPWANLTVMVPGEADAYCACEVKLTGSCILTNDSDLLLYDLGSHGSVIFLDSVELSPGHLTHPLRMKAAMLQPSLVARRLGITCLLSFAYELKGRPDIKMLELLQRSNNTLDLVDLCDYRKFVEEYKNDLCGEKTSRSKQPRTILDTRISELWWQYQSRSEDTGWNCARLYLSSMNEDYTKQCAWVKGRLYRKIGYSILNLSRPINERLRHVTEFFRRGQRIAEHEILLQDEKWISEQARSLCNRLQSFRVRFGAEGSFLEFWTLFVLREFYGPDTQLTESEIQKLEQFLRIGYMGKRFEWVDIHLTAQIHAVLYSLRILKQLTEFLNPSDTLAVNLKAALESLPPLHLITLPTSQGLGLCSIDISTTRLLDIFGRSTEQPEDPAIDETARLASSNSSTPTSIANVHNDQTLTSHKNMFNRYAVLEEQ